MTCSHRSCVPNARTPNTCVTVLASQPSVSIDTDTTHRMLAPSVPALPTVFITSRRSSLSGMSPSAWLPVRSTRSRRKRSISSAAITRNLSSSASPDSNSSESISSVFGRGSGFPVTSSKFRNSASRPCSRVQPPSTALRATRLQTGSPSSSRSAMTSRSLAFNSRSARRGSSVSGCSVIANLRTSRPSGSVPNCSTEI